MGRPGNCEDCRHCVQGRCRRFPPEINPHRVAPTRAGGGAVADFPAVEPYWWCGEWTRREAI